MNVQFGPNHGVVQVADRIEVGSNPASYSALATPALACAIDRHQSALGALEELESAATRDAVLLTFLPMAPAIFLTANGWLPSSWVFPAFLISLVFCGIGSLWGQARIASIVARRLRLQQKIQTIENHLNDRHDWDPE